MRDGSSASLSTSSTLVNSDTNTPATSANHPSQLLRPCLNCRKQMQVKELDSVHADMKKYLETEEDRTGKTFNLIELISQAAIPMDAPVCKECADALLRGMNVQLLSLEDDCIKYRTVIDEIKGRHSNADIAEYKRTVEKLKRDEAELLVQLRSIVLEEEKVDRELKEEKKILEETSEEEKDLWRKLRDRHSEVMEGDEAVRAVNVEIRYAQQQLRLLNRTPVFDLAFNIQLASSSSCRPATIAQINGFRLGRLPDCPVEWNEINAAWGQALLLLDVLMERAGLTLPYTNFITHGAWSSIRVTRDGNIKDLPLYACGSWRPFGNKNMDGAACIFVEALSLLMKTLSERRTSEGRIVKWPHLIRGDKLRDKDMEYTVKMQFNGEERWSKAMSALLFNLKLAISLTWPEGS